MAFFDTTGTAGFAPARRASPVTRMFARIAAWNEARLTRKALDSLSDHELSDIGLCRGDIDRIGLRNL